MSPTMLDAKEHSRILADFENVCAVAGVQGRFLKESMTKYCGEDEIDWVKRFNHYKADGLPGLVLEGVPNPDMRCQAIASALVRNYLDARVIPLNSLIDGGSDRPSPSILIIPNLYLNAMAAGKSLPAWRTQVMYDLLLERAASGKPSVVYVEDMKSVSSVYGKPFRDFLNTFKIVTQ